MRKKYCQSCGEDGDSHFFTWIDGFFALIPHFKAPDSLGNLATIIGERVLLFSRLAHYDQHVEDKDLIPRTWCFVDKMRKEGVDFSILRLLGAPTNNLKMEIKGKKFTFEILPLATFANGKESVLIENKYKSKQFLKEKGFPVPDGKLFYFWQVKRALSYGEELGFPLVVKPLGGSISRHVTTDIKSIQELRDAIEFSLTYAPGFIIEKYITDTPLYRATVVDENEVFIVEELPGNVTGDGVHTVEELVKIKNGGLRSTDKRRDRLLYPVIVDSTSMELLRKKGLTLQTIPKHGERVLLQKDPFPKLGYDLREVTDIAHEDNVSLCIHIAKAFNTRVVGMDILFPDITKSWKEGGVAFLEANSAPCIELHETPTEGPPSYPSKALARMFFKYYM